MTTSIQSIDDSTSAMLVNGQESLRLTPEGISTPTLNGGQLAGFRNRIINGNFVINQRNISSANTAYGANVYILDRWKAGPGGCTLSWAASGNDIVVTINAGTLIQIIESTHIEGGVYLLSHEGTAQARIGVDGTAPAGSYVAASKLSPLASASATGGSLNMAVEFSVGSVSRVMLEKSDKATPFERRPYDVELRLCQRYYEYCTPCILSMLKLREIDRNRYIAVWFKARKRATPTVTSTWAPDGAGNFAVNATLDQAQFTALASSDAGAPAITSWIANAEL